MRDFGIYVCDHSYMMTNSNSPNNLNQLLTSKSDWNHFLNYHCVLFWSASNIYKKFPWKIGKIHFRLCFGSLARNQIGRFIAISNKYSAKKSRIWETKNLLTDTDSRTDTILERLHYFFGGDNRQTDNATLWKNRTISLKITPFVIRGSFSSAQLNKQP